MDAFQTALVSADRRIQGVRIVKGPGSDGPFIRPDYFLHVTVENEPEIALSAYRAYAGEEAISVRHKGDPLTDLIEKLDKAYQQHIRARMWKGHVQMEIKIPGLRRKLP